MTFEFTGEGAKEASDVAEQGMHLFVLAMREQWLPDFEQAYEQNDVVQFLVLINDVSNAMESWIETLTSELAKVGEHHVRYLADKTVRQLLINRIINLPGSKN